MVFAAFSFCQAGGLCSSRVEYAARVRRMQCRVRSPVYLWQLGAQARGQSATARGDMWVLFRSAFPGVALYPAPPGVPEKRAGPQQPAYTLYSTYL